MLGKAIVSHFVDRGVGTYYTYMSSVRWMKELELMRTRQSKKKDNVWGSRYASKEKGEQGAEDGVRARPLPPTPSCAFGDCVVQLLQRMPLVRRLQTQSIWNLH